MKRFIDDEPWALILEEPAGALKDQKMSLRGLFE